MQSFLCPWIVWVHLFRFPVVLDGQFAVTVISVCHPEAIVDVGGLRIGFHVELKDLDCRLKLFLLHQYVPEPIKITLEVSVEVNRICSVSSDRAPGSLNIFVQHGSADNIGERWLRNVADHENTQDPKWVEVAVMNSSGQLIMECILETKAATLLEFIQGLHGTLSVTFEEGTSAAWLHDLLKPHVSRRQKC